MTGIKIDPKPGLLPNIAYSSGDSTVSVEIKGLKTSPYLNELKRFMDMVGVIQERKSHTDYVSLLAEQVKNNQYAPNLDVLADQIMIEVAL